MKLLRKIYISPFSRIFLCGDRGCAERGNSAYAHPLLKSCVRCSIKVSIHLGGGVIQSAFYDLLQVADKVWLSIQRGVEGRNR
jgi:hypothetical protein